jgi:hypothetical protein
LAALAVVNPEDVSCERNCADKARRQHLPAVEIDQG